MDTPSAGQKCNCPHHKMAPGFIVLLGLLFLLAAFNVFTPRFVEIAWPIIVIAIGLQKLFQHNCKGCPYVG